MHAGSRRLVLRLYSLPEDRSSQQPLIERAEEDLLCAIALYRQRACDYSPLVNVCYLLHQVIEKWLKLLIAVEGIHVSASGQHDLYSRFEVLEQYIPEFKGILTGMDPVLLGHKFPGNLRYGETPADIERHVETLIKVAFKVRWLAKRYLNQRLNQE